MSPKNVATASSTVEIGLVSVIETGKLAVADSVVLVATESDAVVV
jgi:hypothetical protein